MKNLNDLIKVGHDISSSPEAKELPYGIVTISHQDMFVNNQHYSYVGLEAGSKDRFVNVEGYQRYADLFVVYNKSTCKYTVEHNTHKGSKTESLVINDELSTDEFRKICEEFIERVKNLN